MKYLPVMALLIALLVTPLVGVWIEMSKVVGSFSKGDVTPLVGVWIEISYGVSQVSGIDVTPLVGVWIEI